MGSLISQLFALFAPIAVDLYEKHKAANGGIAPTHDQLVARFAAHKDEYLGEGAAWRGQHPPGSA